MTDTRSRYTRYGLSFFDWDAAADNMWKITKGPHPALISPSVGFGKFDDFIDLAVDDSTGLPTAWTCTEVDVGAGNTTVALADAVNGVLKLEAAGNENDGANIQLKGESFKLTSTNKLWFDARVMLDEATQSDAFVGLAATDTSIIASVPAVYVGFFKDDGDTNWDFCSNDTGETEVAAVDTAVAATYAVLGFYWNGTTLTPYIDGVAGTAITTTANIPQGAADEMSLSFAYLNGDAQASKGLNIDYYRIVQLKD